MYAFIHAFAGAIAHAGIEGKRTLLDCISSLETAFIDAGIPNASVLEPWRIVRESIFIMDSNDMHHEGLQKLRLDLTARLAVCHSLAHANASPAPLRGSAEFFASFFVD